MFVAVSKEAFFKVINPLNVHPTPEGMENRYALVADLVDPFKLEVPC